VKSTFLSARPVISLPTPGQVPTEFRVLRAGKNLTEKGEFIFDDEAAEAVMAAYAAKGVDKVQIDYEHQSTQAPPAGGDASKPAAGWFKPEVRNGELWAVELAWTTKAASMLAPAQGAPEYRYFSPILFFDEKTRRVTRLKNIALTNDPAMDEIEALAAASAIHHDKETPMPCENCSTLAAQIKELTAELSAAKAAAKDKSEATTALTGIRSQLCAITGKATEAEALGVVAGLKTAHEELSAFKAKVDQEKSAKLTADFTGMLDGFVKLGKMMPGGTEKANQRGYWEAKAKTNGVEDAIAGLTACAPLLGQIVKPGGEGSPTPLAHGVASSTEGIAMSARMGIDEAKFQEAQAKRRAAGLSTT
jgi:phage I-like protein